jgi:UDP-glucose:(heptosyl)LPS alpha-1,3-glucosyltransferase
MKIGIQIERFTPDAGGAEAYTCSLARLLLAHGHEVHVFARFQGEIPEGIDFHQVPVSGWLRQQQDLSFGRNADRLALARELDVLLGTGKTFAMDVLLPHGGTVRRSQEQNIALVRSLLHRRLKAFYNRISPKHRVARRRETCHYTRNPLPLFVAISRMVADDMKRFYQVPDSRLHIIYHGVDTVRFHPERLAPLREGVRDRFGIDRSRMVFAFAGHNFKLKGVRQLLEAAALLGRSGKGFSILIAGKANPRPYQKLAAHLGCIANVIFPGPMQRIEELYAAADVYIHPAWYDPFSLVVLEALASGLPVVTTRFTGAGELITDGREGFIVDTPEAVSYLAEAMALFFDGDRLAEMKSAARLLGEQYSCERNLSELMKVLELAAAEKRMIP